MLLISWLNLWISIFITKLCCTVSPWHWIKSHFQLQQYNNGLYVGGFFFLRLCCRPLTAPWPSTTVFFFYVLLDDVLLVASTPPQISVDQRSSYIICSPSQLIYTCELIQFNREIETTELLISIRHIYWLFHLPPYVTEQPQKYCYQCVLLGDEFHSSLIRTPVHGSWVWHEKKKKKKRNYQAIMSTLAVGPQVKWILKESWIRSPVIGDGLWNPLKSLL